MPRGTDQLADGRWQSEKCWLHSAAAGKQEPRVTSMWRQRFALAFLPRPRAARPESHRTGTSRGAQQTCSIQLNSSPSRVSTSPLFSVGLLGPGWPIALLELRSICKTVYVRQRRRQNEWKSPLCSFSASRVGLVLPTKGRNHLRITLERKERAKVCLDGSARAVP